MLRERLSGFSELPRLHATLLVAGLLLCTWAVVFAAGGTRTAWPHLFYLPVVFAVMPLGRRGGIVTGIAAMMLCGPLMPLDVVTGASQTPGNWLVRGVFFTIVGGLAGTAARTSTTGMENALTARLTAELDGPTPPERESADAGLIRDIIDRCRFTTVFQPIYDLHDGQLISVEALTRFTDMAPAQSAATWFAQAADVGLGTDLELATAAAALEATTELPDHVSLSLNTSPALVTDARLEQLFQQHAGRKLVVELTEHVVVDDYAALRTALDGLRSRGIQVAVDDAGAGFASLQHIVRLQPDIIKLDISLTQQVRDDPVRRALAAALVQFAQQTDTLLVAEGIEAPADLTTWQDIGAHAGQGYLLGRPAPMPLPLTPLANPTHLTSPRHPVSDLSEVGG